MREVAREQSVNHDTDKDELISVIIPAYNIEPYLERCVDSVMSQTYANLEVVLVDDGSTDGSGEICDFYAKADDRICVIHKPNGGQAEARNRGLDLAKGNYILFVDGDDYIAPEHIKLLYQGLREQDADIACCGHVRSSGESVVWPECRNIYYRYESMEAIYAMLYVKGISFSPWCKLYRKELFDGIRYPAGQIYEDLATTYRVVAKADGVIWTEDQTYCYFQRDGSTIRSAATQKNMVAFSFLQEIEMSFPADQKLHKAVSSHYINLCIDFLKNRQSESKIEMMIWKHVRDKRMEVLLNRGAPLRVRLFSILSFTGLRVTKKVLDLYYKAP